MTDKAKADLCRISDERGRCWTWITLCDDSAIRVDRFDYGPYTDEMRGGDYERWIIMTPDTHQALRDVLLPKVNPPVPGSAQALDETVYELLRTALDGRIDAVTLAEGMCHEAHVPFVSGSWN